MTELASSTAERMAKVIVDLARANRECTDQDLAEAGFSEFEVRRYRALASGYADVDLKVSRR